MNEEIEELKNGFYEFKENSKTQKFIQEVMICFWYAIHSEKIEMAQFIYSLHSIIRDIMKNLREN